MATRICWHCKAHAHQTLVGEPARTVDLPRKWYGYFRCDSCGWPSIAVLPEIDEPNIYKADITSALNHPEVPFLDWYPHALIGKRFDDVPTLISEAASEAWACYSVRQFRASALMARTVVEAIAKEFGFTQGNLVNKIDAMCAADRISKLSRDAAHEIRLIGNEQAHGDLSERIDEETCADVLSFMDNVLHDTFEQEARLNRFRASRGRTIT